MKRYQLKKQLFRQTMFFIFIILLLISMFTSYFLYQSSKSDYISLNNRFLTVMNEQIEHFLMHPEEELKLIEKQILSSEKPQNIREEIKFIIDRFSYIYRVDVVNQSGIITASFPTNHDLIGIDLSRNSVITAAENIDASNTVYGDTFIDPLTGNISMTITMKTKNRGFLVGYLNLESLYASFKGIDFDEGIYAVIDGEGRYLLFEDQVFVNQRRVNEHYEKIRLNQVRSGASVMFNGVHSIIQYQEISETGWTLIIYQNTKKIIMPILYTLGIILAAYIIMYIGIFFSLNYNLKRVEKILKNLVQLTRSVSKGHYDIVIPDHYYEEFQMLSDNFKQMIDEVEIREEEIYNLSDQLEKSYLDTVFLLARAIEAKDTYTGNHCERVKKYALMIGESVGINEKDKQDLITGSLLHDIGKLNISERILTKASRLTDEEYAIIKKHSAFGYDLIKDIPRMTKAKEIVLYHHERFDGLGYPKGLKGKEIPFLARIVCIADAFDAMTSQRVYKEKPLNLNEAIEELELNKNTQFDGDLVEAFINAITKNREYNDLIE